MKVAVLPPTGSSRAEVVQAVRKYWTSRHIGSANWHVATDLLYGVADQDWVFAKTDVVELADGVSFRTYRGALIRALPGSDMLEWK